MKLLRSDFEGLDLDDGLGGEDSPTFEQTLRLLLAPMAGVLLNAFARSVMTTALPTVVGELGALRHLPWVVSTGLVATAASIPVYGRLSDQFGRRRLFRVAVTTVIVGTIAGSVAQTLPQLLAAQALQGIGLGGLMTMPLAIVADLFSPRERGQYVGYTVSMHVLASVLGPLVGGMLVDHLSWRLALLSPLPVALWALHLSRRIPEHGNDDGDSVDLASALMLAAAVTLAMVTVLVAGQVGWTSPGALLAAGSTVASIGAYAAIARRSASPVIPLALLRDPTVAITSIVGLLLGLSLHGSMAFLPVFFQISLATSASVSGFLMLPLMAGLVMTSVPAGRFVTRVGRYRSLAMTGSALLVVGYLAFSTLGVGSSLLAAVLLVALLGAGIGMTMPMILIAVQAAVPASQLGVATAVHQLSKAFGAGLGVAAMGAVWNTRLTTLLVERLPADGSVTTESVLSSPQAVASLPAPLTEAVRHAVSGATATTFLIIGCLAIVTHVISWRLREMSS